MTPRGFIACTIAVAGACHLAAAQSLMFEEYAPGTQLHGVDGWRGWDNHAASGAATSALFAHSGSSSVAITGSASGSTSDLVHEYNITSGPLRFTAWQYIPTGATGDTYLILMDRYKAKSNGNQDQGNKHWATQLHFDLSTDTLHDNLFGSFGSLPVVRDQWAQIRVDIDLAANSQSIWYNDQHLATLPWNRYSGGAMRLQAVDLYGSSTTTVYYDDVGVASIPTPGSVGLASMGFAAALLRRRGRAPGPTDLASQG